MSRTSRSWLVMALIVAPAVVLQMWMGVEYSSWVRWIMIVFVFLLGSAILISPQRASNMRPALARATGALLVVVAALNAYFQFTQTSSE